jgi:hypothetical protein
MSYFLSPGKKKLQVRKSSKKAKHAIISLYYLILYIFHQALFRAVGMDSEDFKFGMTKVFFRPGKVRLSNEHRGLGTVCHYALARIRARVEPRSPSLKGKRDHDTTKWKLCSNKFMSCLHKTKLIIWSFSLVRRVWSDHAVGSWKFESSGVESCKMDCC